ncbi:YqgE/AlgH family protein [Xinfangfangia sp. CPCC 101601]|uniref:UPF0301 protein Q9295_13615 n=1 Tax=Pseudogemmobacter lacusdianii TaxID=3069608 RepID=A0ABU0W071_9RHOB|nr:YqgE/AlgH family protein [Xinfangfangia sp. CPCC 101601]MDQ2067411.1 YqgE/AlgH family protein [Xinfangfangia sp. CPCC 101601]
MRTIDDAQDLAGKLLIAMPGMEDTRFQRSVIFICAHTAEGAMGLIINKPSAEMTFAALLEQLAIRRDASLATEPALEGVKAAREIAVHFGGPVERGRGFVLHSEDWQGAAELGLAVPGGYRMTATLDVLEALAIGQGPSSALLALGYSGWGAGQLEAEILRNDWLVCPADPELVFGSEDGAKWGGALRRLGIDPVTLSHQAGRA